MPDGTPHEVGIVEIGKVSLVHDAYLIEYLFLDKHEARRRELKTPWLIVLWRVVLVVSEMCCGIYESVFPTSGGPELACEVVEDFRHDHVAVILFEAFDEQSD